MKRGDARVAAALCKCQLGSVPSVEREKENNGRTVLRGLGGFNYQRKVSDSVLVIAVPFSSA